MDQGTQRLPLLTKAELKPCIAIRTLVSVETSLTKQAFELKKNYSDRVTDKTSATSGWVLAGMEWGGYGIGEESIVVVAA